MRNTFDVLLYDNICCQMYENNGQLRKSSHRLSSTTIRNHPYIMQMTGKLYKVFFSKTVELIPLQLIFKFPLLHDFSGLNCIDFEKHNMC